MILGVIVTYNPTAKQLQANIDAVITQVDQLLIVDNGSEHLSVLQREIEVQYLHENKGIAYALNCALRYAEEHGFDYLFTLDQDSVVSEQMISLLLTTLTMNPQVAMVGPRIEDHARGEGRKETGCVEVQRLITSGTLCRVEALQAVHGFDNALFIDEVDHDISYRLLLAGYQLLQNNDVVLQHELGHVETKQTIYGSRLEVNNHSAFRLFYIGRNQVYMIRKYGNKIKGLRTLQIRDLLSRYKQILLGEEQKIKKIYALTKGIVTGLFFKT